MAWPQQHGGDSFRAGLKDESRLLLVAESRGRIVATLSGSVSQPSAMRPLRAATLVSLYVKPELRGSGLGARMVAEFRTWAQRQGAERMSVTAYEANTGALRFYQRMGFVAHQVTLEAELETPPP